MNGRFIDVGQKNSLGEHGYSTVPLLQGRLFRVIRTLNLDCDTLKDERTNILGERIHSGAWPMPDPNNNVYGSGMEIIKTLLGI